MLVITINHSKTESRHNQADQTRNQCTARHNQDVIKQGKTEMKTEHTTCRYIRNQSKGRNKSGDLQPSAPRISFGNLPNLRESTACLLSINSTQLSTLSLFFLLSYAIAVLVYTPN
jgi:hypothetical protein